MKTPWSRGFLWAKSSTEWESPFPIENCCVWFVCVAQFHWTMVNDGKFEICMPSIYKLGWVECKKIIIFSLSYKVDCSFIRSSAFGSQVYWQPSFYLIQSTLCVCENFHKSNLGIQRIFWSGQIIRENWWICCDSFWRYFMQIHRRVFSVKTGLCLGPKIKSRSPNLKRVGHVCSPL